MHPVRTHCMEIHVLVHLCQLLSVTEEQIPYYTPGNRGRTFNPYTVLDTSLCLDKDLRETHADDTFLNDGGIVVDVF